MSLSVENTDLTFQQVITGRVPFASFSRNETVMLKVIKGDRPERPPSGLSDTLWGLLVAAWVGQYAQKPRERPSTSAVLTQLKDCVDQWGKSIIPLIPEDWGETTTASSFQHQIDYPDAGGFGPFDLPSNRLCGPPILTQPLGPG